MNVRYTLHEPSKLPLLTKDLPTIECHALRIERLSSRQNFLHYSTHYNISYPQEVSLYNGIYQIHQMVRGRDGIDYTITSRVFDLNGEVVYATENSG